MDIKIKGKNLPGLYQSADKASIKEQKKYFRAIKFHISLLIIGAFMVDFYSDSLNPLFKITSVLFFLSSLFIMLWLRAIKPHDVWYNGRAVAESVKTRAWRWMLRAEPYEDAQDIEIMRTSFIRDLKTILKQNQNLIGKLGPTSAIEEPISDIMFRIRSLNIKERVEFYRKERITNQALWYSKKAKFNKDRAFQWFLVTVILHSAAILLLLYNIKEPSLKLPIETLVVAAAGVLTWLQSKKHNELASSYSLTTHEIMLIKSEVNQIRNEKELSDYVMNCENAFSREHTQWFARKSQ